MVEEFPNRRREDADAGRTKPTHGWEVALRNRALIIGCIALAIVAGVTFTMVATPIYEAETSIRIDREQPELRINQVLDNLSRNGQVSTEMEVLRSRVLAEDVADSLGLQLSVLEPGGPSRSELLSPVRISRDASEAEYTLRREGDDRFTLIDDQTSEERGPYSPGDIIELDHAVLRLAAGARAHEEIRFRVEPFAESVKILRESLDVGRPNSEANVVTVRYESADTQLVHQVPNALAGAFIERRQGVKSMEARSRVSFLGDQIDTIAAQLRAAEDALRAFQETEQIASLQEEARTRVQQLATLQGERSRLETERTALAQLLDDVRATAESREPDEPSPYRRLLGFPSMLRNQAASQLLGSLTEVENQRAEMLRQRTDRDPDVRVLTDRIHELEAQIHSLAATYQDGLADQVASLDATLAAFGGELADIPGKQVELARLQRQTQILGEIYTLLQTRLKEAEIAAATRDQSIRIVDPAIRPVEPIRPRMLLNLLLACVFGLLIGLGTAMTREVMDTTVHSEDDAEEILGVPMLGLIPRIRDAETARPFDAAGGASASRSRLITDRDPSNPVSEAYRALRTNVTFARPGDPVRTLLITSPLPGDGKTTSAANLAVTFALQGQDVVLVDADLRRGALFEDFDARREPGLSNLALGTADLGDVVQEIEVGDERRLHFVATGTMPPNPSELLGSDQVETIVSDLEEHFDIVIIDSPPVNVVTDAPLLSRHVDGVLLVARAEATHRGGLRHAAEQLRNVQAPLLGGVLNDIVYARGRRYGGKYGGYGPYHYAYDEVEQRKAMPARIAARLGWDRLPWTSG